tara:strand:- start:379 stop:816 length:438 start_codon:yes stop_codon:yes gene_type:complete
MKSLKNIFYDKELFSDSRDWGLLILRVIPSFYLFYYHGMRKIGSGVDTWHWLGEAAMPVIGVSFGYVIFGFIASLSEGVFTWLVLVGFQTRLASLFIMLTMFLAGTYHLNDGESGESAFIYFTIYLTIFFWGAGKFSVDNRLKII